MNNNEGLEVVTNLELGLHPPNHNIVVENPDEELGVGANAASRGDMIFLANDTLSELVWSPHKGLSVRCTVGTDKRSSFFWAPGSADMVLSSQHDDFDTRTNLENLGQERISEPSPTASKDDWNSTTFQSGQARHSGSSESKNTVAVHEAMQVNSPGLEGVNPGNALPDSEDVLNHAGSAENKLECVAENDMPPSDKFSKDSADKTLQLQACDISKAAPITTLASSAKGKERIPSDEDLKKEASQEDEEEDSYKSVESSNSSRKPLSKKKRTLSFNEQLISESKRLKMQVRETPVTLSLARNSSSFANWISAMVKGSLTLPSTGNEKKVLDSSSREQDRTSDSTGFQSMFQSIYQPGTRKVQDQILLCSKSDDNLVLKDASAKKVDHLSSLFVAHFCPKPTQQNAAGSLGAHRKSQRNIGWLEDGKNVPMHKSSSEEPNYSQKRHNFSDDVKEVESQNMNQIVHFQGVQSSEAMASVFAKRLDALKNIMPSDLTDKLGSSSTRTCFFCGVVGHDLKYCPQLTETEVEELVKNMSAYGGKEESPCLCIRCFQLNHWAASCPNAITSSKKKEELEWHKKGYVRDLSFPDVIDRQSQALRVMTGQGLSHGAYKPPGVGTGRKVNAVISEENATQFTWFPYPCGSSMPRGIFEAVKSLQLSRTDIMKWMNSIFSVSLDGYYLRLRHKLGDGHGRTTQYHVACIFSPKESKSAETSKRPIYVTVGRTRCSVETQYISNQHFHEDELKEWWSETLKGDHDEIPSEDELRSKIEERRRLDL